MLEIKNIVKTYNEPGLFSTKWQRILKDVSFCVDELECLGLIGESGSGKSTLGRLILGIEKPDSGEILFDGKDVRRARNRRGKLSAVFQDYTASIDPNRTVFEAIREPMDVLGMYCDRQAAASLLKQVGLDGDYLDRYQHELSGGETQRVCIARAISTNPKFLLLDEAISSLDVSVQVQILDLLRELRKSCSMSYLFITHDIQAAAYICDRLIIFKSGEIVEETPISRLGEVREEYSKKLLHSVITV